MYYSTFGHKYVNNSGIKAGKSLEIKGGISTLDKPNLKKSSRGPSMETLSLNNPHGKEKVIVQNVEPMLQVGIVTSRTSLFILSWLPI